MFRMSLTFNAPRLTRLRGLFPRAQANLQARLDANVKPLIQADVQELMAPYPGMVVYPFAFATPRSRRFYFANFQPPYQRSGALANSWEVNIAGGGLSFGQRLTSILSRQPVGGEFVIIVDNTYPAAIYIYGPRQVAGHRNTGWGANLRAQAEIVVARAKAHIAAEWRGAVHDAVWED